MTDCVIMRVEKAEIRRVLQDEPAFSQMFVSHILARNARVEEDLVDQLFNSTEKRLARVLLLLANFGKEGRPEPIIAKISQETLAEMIGTTRSRVSHFMNKFRELGFIDYNGHLEVHSSLLSVFLNDQANTVDAAGVNFRERAAPPCDRPRRRILPIIAPIFAVDRSRALARPDRHFPFVSNLEQSGFQRRGIAGPAWERAHRQEIEILLGGLAPSARIRIARSPVPIRMRRPLGYSPAPSRRAQFQGLAVSRLATANRTEGES